MERKPDLSALLAIDDAVATVIGEARAMVARRPPETEFRALWEARGMVLAADIHADRDHPPFDRSAMDGWAIRAAELTPGHGDSAEFDVAGEVAAGTVFEGEVGPGQAVAIMTGAPVPAGADAVQMVEKSERIGEGGHRVRILGPMRVGQNIRYCGEDLPKGEIAVERGRILDGLTCGVVASLGCETLEVYQRPRVSVMATGDELVDIGEVPGPGQIRESNRHTLFGLLGERCVTVDGGRVADDEDTLRMAIREGMRSDVLVLSGGVSAGEYDFVADALLAEGCEIIFHKVRMKPGKPVLVAKHEGGLVFGLPGNPVSTFVTAQVFLLPALRILAGRREPGPWTISAKLLGAIRPTKGRTTLLAGYLTQRAGRWQVRPIEINGSGDQISFARGNCLIRREIGAPAAEDGEKVTVVLSRPPVSF